MRVSISLLLLVTAIGCRPSAEREDNRPNILFIMSDDHTSQAWGIYDGVLENYAKNTNIRRLASQGMVLENAFCTNSICVPSRGSILTGQYSHHNGIYTLSEGLHPDSSNIAKVLQANGYTTAIIGKWHLKQRPNGFDHFLVLPGQGVYHNPRLKSAEDWENGNRGGKEYPGYSADVIGDQAVEWLRSRDTSRPFFLMTHFKATHEPFDYPERYRDFLSADTLPYPSSLFEWDPAGSGRTFVGQQLEILGNRWLEDSKRPEGKRRYPGMPFSLDGLSKEQAYQKIYQKFVKDFLRGGAAIDDNIGKLLDYLDEAGVADNTVVIYTADQGYFLGEHGFMDKRMIYEESLRMPFVIRYPQEVAAGSRLGDMILNIDFPALFADYAGVEKPAFITGRSFRANLAGNTPSDWRTRMYYRYWLHQRQRPAHLGLRTERYKLTFFYGQPLGMPGAHADPTDPAWEFYDLAEDPSENRNAYHDPAYAQVIDELKEELLTLKLKEGDRDDARPVMQAIFEQYWEREK